MKNLKNKIKNKKGITLIALIITIIILLILAGVSIAQLTDSGLFKKSKLAKEAAKNAQELENSILGDYENQIAALGNRDYKPISYSTSEQDTGLKWIDGKTIWQKTINCGTLPNKSTTSIAHNISNFGYLISLNGTASNGSTYYTIPLVSSATTWLTEVTVDSTNINITTINNYSAYTGIITIQYTKTTPTTNE